MENSLIRSVPQSLWFWRRCNTKACGIHHWVPTWPVEASSCWRGPVYMHPFDDSNASLMWDTVSTHWSTWDPYFFGRKFVSAAAIHSLRSPYNRHTLAPFHPTQPGPSYSTPSDTNYSVWSDLVEFFSKTPPPLSRRQPSRFNHNNGRCHSNFRSRNRSLRLQTDLYGCVRRHFNDHANVHPKYVIDANEEATSLWLPSARQPLESISILCRCWKCYSLLYVHCQSRSGRRRPWCSPLLKRGWKGLQRRHRSTGRRRWRSGCMACRKFCCFWQFLP